jgi:hypothetical protein
VCQQHWDLSTEKAPPRSESQAPVPAHHPVTQLGHFRHGPLGTRSKLRDPVAASLLVRGNLAPYGSVRPLFSHGPALTTVSINDTGRATACDPCPGANSATGCTRSYRVTRHKVVNCENSDRVTHEQILLPPPNGIAKLQGSQIRAPASAGAIRRFLVSFSVR